jgi:cell wall-associated NlpC family hydrolase
MSGKSRLRSKATYQYQPKEEGTVRNQILAGDQPSVEAPPKAVNDASVPIQTALAEQAPQIAVKDKAASRQRAYRKLSHTFVVEQPKVVSLQQAEKIQVTKPKASPLRFKSQGESPVSNLQFGKPVKVTQLKKPKNLSIAPALWLRTRLQEETKNVEDQNSGTDALQAGERSAYSLQSRMHLLQTKSSKRSVTSMRQLQARSLRQQAEAFATENLKSRPVRNPVLRYFQKQRIKREYLQGYRAATRLRSTATRQRTAQGAKKLFSKVVQVVKSRAALYASIVLVLLLLAGSVASFAFSATTVMGGNIIGGLAESLRGSEGMVEVARSQLGQVGGEPYWSWYGFPSRVEWCAIFVSWVADQNGFISEGRFPKFAGCSAGESWFRSTDAWQERGYQPSPGEIIFFDWNGDGVPDHVGIVESSDGSTVYTIEGNWADSVHTDAYPINSSQIYGYGTPNYYE